MGWVYARNAEATTTGTGASWGRRTSTRRDDHAVRHGWEFEGGEIRVDDEKEKPSYEGEGEADERIADNFFGRAHASGIAGARHIEETADAQHEESCDADGPEREFIQGLEIAREIEIAGASRSGNLFEEGVIELTDTAWGWIGVREFAAYSAARASSGSINDIAAGALIAVFAGPGFIIGAAPTYRSISSGRHAADANHLFLVVDTSTNNIVWSDTSSSACRTSPILRNTLWAGEISSLRRESYE